MTLWRALLAVCAVIGALVAGAFWWLAQPLALAADKVEVMVQAGDSARDVAQKWRDAGVEAPAWALQIWFRASGEAKRIQAGSYMVEPGVTPRSLLDKMVRGEQTLETFRIIEGWSWRQVRQALTQTEHLQHTTATLSDEALAKAVGIPASHPEGWLFPDTYRFGRGVSDLTVLRQAHLAMATRLEKVWAERDPSLPLQTPQDLLILASVVEKETGAAADRGQIAGVFVNRLKLGMPLQSDPTVIYGLGERFDGNLRKADLQADTPWNSYTRKGLPVTPIAMPGLAALRATARPDATRALYFVARGDGSSVFSQTLADHNRAVNQYQRGNAP